MGERETETAAGCAVAASVGGGSGSDGSDDGGVSGSIFGAVAFLFWNVQHKIRLECKILNVCTVCTVAVS